MSIAVVRRPIGLLLRTLLLMSVLSSVAVSDPLSGLGDEVYGTAQEQQAVLQQFLTGGSLGSLRSYHSICWYLA